VRYAPMTAVTGDLYDFPKVAPNCIGMLVADVTGHGVPGALVASMVKVAFLAVRSS
jgi:serine phosphatase RsbU (regulator of sigma subunit)